MNVTYNTRNKECGRQYLHTKEAVGNAHKLRNAISGIRKLKKWSEDGDTNQYKEHD